MFYCVAGSRGLEKTPNLIDFPPHSQDVVFDAVVRNLEIIGEAAKHLPPEGKAMMPQVDWNKVAGFRDVIVHGYFGLDVHVIWDVVQAKVPALVSTVEGALHVIYD